MRKWEVAATFTVSVLLHVDHDELTEWVDGRVPPKRVEAEILRRGTVVEHELQSVDYVDVEGDEDTEDPRR